MNIQLTKSAKEAELQVLPLFSSELATAKFAGFPLLAQSDFKNRLGSTQVVYVNSSRVLLVGLGERKDFTSAQWRVVIHSIMMQATALEIASFNLILPKLISSQLTETLEMLGFSIVFSSYQFDHYKKDKKPSKLSDVNIVAPVLVKLNSALNKGINIGTAANSARALADHPGNVATPTHLAEHAIALAKQFGFECKVLGPKEIEKEKMGLLTGVSLGSDQPPKFIILEYGPKSKPPIVLVGKGLTFDSGGVSIKPADRMEEMKYDMCGGATVLGIFEAAAKLKLPVHLVGLIPSSENLVSGKAAKPGDILVALNGTSVEIINTDAEGRLVLADAISFAKKYYKPKLLIDYATLTGAILIALGDSYTGYYSNTSKYQKQFGKSAGLTSEKFWEMPLSEEYEDQLKSSIADIKNIGEKGSAGATTAALFIQHFVGVIPWIHLDIAGTAWTTRPKPYAGTGATAWGVYLTIDFLRNIR